MATPSRSKLTTSSGYVYWSDDSKFDGFLLVSINMPEPQASEGAYPEVSVDARYPRVRIPQWITIPIIDGVIDQHCTLIYTASLEPPNTRYYIYYLDITMQKILAEPGDSDAFAVSEATTTITQPTLTVPTAPTEPGIAPNL